MKALILLPLLALAACESFQTPESRYYALNEGVTVAAKQAGAYIDACKAKPIDDACKTVVPKLGQAAQITKDTLKETDKVFVAKESDRYDLTLALAENALAYLNNTLAEGGK